MKNDNESIMMMITVKIESGNDSQQIILNRSQSIATHNSRIFEIGCRKIFRRLNVHNSYDYRLTNIYRYS